MCCVFSGYLYQVFRRLVKVAQVCSEVIESTDFPRPDGPALLAHQKVKLSDGQRVTEATVHHQIRRSDDARVCTTSIPLPSDVSPWP